MNGEDECYFIEAALLLVNDHETFQVSGRGVAEKSILVQPLYQTAQQQIAAISFSSRVHHENEDRETDHSSAYMTAQASMSATNTAVVDLRTVRPKRIIVAMTGATGAILGIKLLLMLRKLHVETHLIMSHWAEQTIKYETDYTPSNVRALADHVYSIHDQAAPVSSGSFHTDGMIVVPCSVKTLAGINAGYCNDSISRAADVVIKERRRLVLGLRETPLSEIHLRNMLEVTRAGAIICPTVPAFYTKPETIDDMCDQMLGRMMDLFEIDTKGFARWNGMEKS